MAGIGGGAKEGVLLKGGDSIDVFAKTDIFVFDKTGTLTQGKPSVTALHAYGMEAAEALTYGEALTPVRVCLIPRNAFFGFIKPVPLHQSEAIGGNEPAAPNVDPADSVRFR